MGVECRFRPVVVNSPPGTKRLTIVMGGRNLACLLFISIYIFAGFIVTSLLIATTLNDVTSIFLNHNRRHVIILVLLQYSRILSLYSVDSFTNLLF